MRDDADGRKIRCRFAQKAFPGEGEVTKKAELSSEDATGIFDGFESFRNCMSDDADGRRIRCRFAQKAFPGEGRWHEPKG